jgi:hypothetical protein
MQSTQPIAYYSSSSTHITSWFHRIMIVTTSIVLIIGAIRSFDSIQDDNSNMTNGNYQDALKRDVSLNNVVCLIFFVLFPTEMMLLCLISIRNHGKYKYMNMNQMYIQWSTYSYHQSVQPRRRRS